jgi:hypothetical protein
MTVGRKSGIEGGLTVYFVDDLPQTTGRARLTVQEIMENACVLGAEVREARLVLNELRGGIRVSHRDRTAEIEIRPRQRFLVSQDL